VILINEWHIQSNKSSLQEQILHKWQASLTKEFLNTHSEIGLGNNTSGGRAIIGCFDSSLINKHCHPSLVAMIIKLLSCGSKLTVDLISTKEFC
jgi:hypothetical protein